MGLDAPGVDPVADHTWCCEHPEPWHYFQEEAEARLLSGLSRVFRVDPVETSWSLRIAEWTASERAIEVLEEILSENAVTPKVRKRCQRLLRLVAQRPKIACEPEENTHEHETVEELLACVRSPEGGTRRARAADALGTQLSEIEFSSIQVAALSELVGMEHPSSDPILQSWTLQFPSCNAVEEANLLLSASASSRPVAFEFLEARLANSRRGFEIYDVYEAIRALMRSRPSNATQERLDRLLSKLRTHGWWRSSSPEERSQMMVVESALSQGKSLNGSAVIAWLERFIRPDLKGNYRQEAFGFLVNGRGLRVLKRGLTDPELFVRREAARSLRRHNTENAVQILVDHVREQILPGHLPLDIEGADVVRYAMDGVLEIGSEGGEDFMYDVFSEPALATHDLRQRAALGLCFLKDARCLESEKSSGLPAVVQAAICPLPSESGDPLEGYLLRVSHWLRDACDWNLDIPEAPLTHLERVKLSRSMVTLSRRRIDHKNTPPLDQMEKNS